MQAIDASNNSFSGALPSAILEGVWLESMDYSANNMTGSIANTITAYSLMVS